MGYPIAGGSGHGLPPEREYEHRRNLDCDHHQDRNPERDHRNTEDPDHDFIWGLVRLFRFTTYRPTWTPTGIWTPTEIQDSLTLDRFAIEPLKPKSMIEAMTPIETSTPGS